MNLDHSSLVKYVRTNDHLADILTNGMFTTMQWHFLLTLFVANQTILSVKVNPQFSRNSVSCSAVAKLHAMSQVMTQAESGVSTHQKY